MLGCLNRSVRKLPAPMSVPSIGGDRPPINIISQSCRVLGGQMLGEERVELNEGDQGCWRVAGGMSQLAAGVWWLGETSLRR